MPNWERKNADVLADAISKHIRSCPGMVDVNASLSMVKDAIDVAASTASTSKGELNRHRAAVCAICCGSKLYECDAPEGWSPNCAFIFSNTTEFGGL